MIRFCAGHFLLKLKGMVLTCKAQLSLQEPTDA